MSKKFGLGRGLGSLIPSANDDSLPPEVEMIDSIGLDQDQASDHKVIYVDPYNISTSHFQPRQLFEHSALEELVNSIKQHGILEPLIASPLEGGKYKLIAGERRLRAAKILNLDKVPVIIREVSEQQRLEISLIENIQRQNLNPLEEAQAYRKLIDEFGLTQAEVAERVGKSRAKIANSLRLLSLPEEVKKMIATGRLSESHAKVILELDNEADQLRLARNVVQRTLSVRDTEQLVKSKYKRPARVINDNLKRISQELSQVLQTKVTIKPKRQGGIIQIEYYSEEDLSSLRRRLKG